MWLLIALLRSMLLIAELALLAPLLYLAVLSVAALATQRRVASSRDRSTTSDTATADATEQLPRFALLIPAHNEASVINVALASIMSVDYPSDRFMPIVIADNRTRPTMRMSSWMQTHGSRPTFCVVWPSRWQRAHRLPRGSIGSTMGKTAGWRGYGLWLLRSSTT
jgi:hypothetical protein